jgi:hypothetical protein
MGKHVWCWLYQITLRICISQFARLRPCQSLLLHLVDNGRIVEPDHYDTTCHVQLAFGHLGWHHPPYIWVRTVFRLLPLVGQHHIQDSRMLPAQPSNINFEVVAPDRNRPIDITMW